MAAADAMALTLRLYSSIYFLCVCISPYLSQSTQQQLTYAVQEEKAEDTFIGNVTKDADLVRLFSPRAWQQDDVHFSISSSYLSNIVSLLKVTKEGVLFTAAPIDREQYCARRARCDIPLTVQAQSIDLFIQISVRLTILDVDDNAPFFRSPNTTIFIPEGGLSGTKLALPLADDLDSPAFGANRYEIVRQHEANRFFLRQTTSPDGGVEDVSLSVLASLDRENIDRYDVRVAAYDTTSSTGVLDVIVIVTDINDNTPVFERNEYEIEVREDEEAGSHLIQLRASDRDAERNGALVYRLSRKSELDSGDMFSIDEETGTVILLQSLDYEMTSEYQLTIIAEDGGTPSNTATTRLTIRVTDFNDNAPQVSIVSLVGGCSDCGSNIYLPATSSIGTTVATLRVTDADSGVNGQFTCQVTENGGGGAYFSLDNNSANNIVVLLRNSVDQLTVAQLPFDVTCEDDGSPVQSAKRTFYVNVITNSVPRFERPEYIVTVPENNAVNANVVQVTAVDVDSGSYGRIRYELETGEDASVRLTFTVDPVTGIIRALIPLDRETRDRYSFHVTATDQGHPPLSASVYVIINVGDVNDLAPTFVSSSFTFVVQENQPPGTCLGQLAAIDLDLDPFNKYRFAVEPPDDSVFSVDSNGNVCTARVLDRELTQTLRFRVKVIDVADSNLYSVAEVVVTVADTNDNKPEIVYPGSDNNTLTIARSLPANRLIVGRVLARDADLGVYSELTYEIISGNDQEYFTIDIATGVIKTNKPITLDMDGREFALDIAVSDSGVPRLRTVATLRIAVNMSAHAAVAGGVADAGVKIIVAIVTVMGLIAVALIIAIATVLRTKRARSKGQRQQQGRAGVSPPGFPPSERKAMVGKGGDGAAGLMQLVVPVSSYSVEADVTEELLGGREREERSLTTFSDAPRILILPHQQQQQDAGRLRERSKEQMQRLLMQKPSHVAVTSRGDVDSMSDSGCSVDTSSPSADVTDDSRLAPVYPLKMRPVTRMTSLSPTEGDRLSFRHLQLQQQQQQQVMQMHMCSSCQVQCQGCQRQMARSPTSQTFGHSNNMGLLTIQQQQYVAMTTPDVSPRSDIPDIPMATFTPPPTLPSSIVSM